MWWLEGDSILKGNVDFSACIHKMASFSFNNNNNNNNSLDYEWITIISAQYLKKKLCTILLSLSFYVGHSICVCVRKVSCAAKLKTTAYDISKTCAVKHQTRPGFFLFFLIK